MLLSDDLFTIQILYIVNFVNRCLYLVRIKTDLGVDIYLWDLLKIEAFCDYRSHYTKVNFEVKYGEIILDENIKYKNIEIKNYNI